MKSKILILALALLLTIGFAGCNGSKENEDNINDLSRPAQSESDLADETAESSDTDAKNDEAGLLATIRDKVLEECKIEDSLPLEKDALERLYSIDISGVKQAAGFVTMDGTFPHEVIMIEATDPVAADAMVKLLENRLSEVKIQSKSYDAKNYALALECTVNKNGNFVSMFLSPDHKKITEVYNEYIK